MLEQSAPRRPGPVHGGRCKSVNISFDALLRLRVLLNYFILWVARTSHGFRTSLSLPIFSRSFSTLCANEFDIKRRNLLESQTV
jgi:hypothetical protein